MSENKFTPGPWHAASTTVYAFNAEGYNRFSAHVYGGDGDFGSRISPDEVTANAVLMSAAPDLLEALQGMLQVYGGGTQWNAPTSVEIELHELAKMAISKARGES